MDFSILGPVEATAQDGALSLGGPRQRALLAYLLLHANRVVAADQLASELWEAPPRDAHAALQNQVSRLRKALGERLVTHAPGYLLRVEPGELDLDRFRAAVANAGATSDLAERSRLLREADGFFRGAALAGVEAPFVAGEAAALEELRLAAVEARVDADLERGRHAELVPELGSLVGRYPLRERLRGQHILALYRCGRQAEALEAYRDTRRMLDEQLGLEPSPALRELERAILTQDPELACAPGFEETQVAAPDEPRRRRELPLALGLGAVALALAGAAAAVALTRSSPEPAPANAAALRPAAVVPAKKHRAHPAHAKHTVAHVKPTVRAKHIVVHVHTTPAASRTVTVPAVTAAPAQTTPVAPKPKPKPSVNPPVTTTPPPAQAVTLSDDFSETTPNTKLWNVFGDGTGATWSLDNGRLVFTVPAAAQTGGTYNMVGPSWSSQCRFDGNFDARIDYQLLEWPAGVGAHLQLSAWIFPKINSASGRMINSYGDQYTGNVGNSFDLVDTQDTQGTLRIARVGSVETAYYLSKGKWVALHSATAVGQTQLGLQLFAQANEWAHREFSVALDNFTVAAVSPVCP